MSANEGHREIPVLRPADVRKSVWECPSCHVRYITEKAPEKCPFCLRPIRGWCNSLAPTPSFLTSASACQEHPDTSPWSPSPSSGTRQDHGSDECHTPMEVRPFSSPRSSGRHAHDSTRRIVPVSLNYPGPK